MKLLTQQNLKDLAANMTRPEADRKPVVKFFNPTGAAIWLISEMDGDTLFGLCDLGQGFPELGNVSFSELSEYQGRFGLGIERDRYFQPAKSLAEYAKEARIQGGIFA